MWVTVALFCVQVTDAMLKVFCGRDVVNLICPGNEIKLKQNNV